jgi:putative PEP-CTERM system histidine kinase
MAFPFFTILPFAAALLSGLLAVASVLRKRPSFATWCFAAGMTVLGIDSLWTGLSLVAAAPPDVLRWLVRGLIAKSLLPLPWLGFSLTYSRGDSREALARWKLPLVMFAALPASLAVAFQDELLQFVPTGPEYETLMLLRSSAPARVLHVVLLVAFVLVLMNLEQTFRSAVGTMRWRIKYVVLGLGVIFGAQIYVRSQAILYSVHDMALAGVESSGLLIGCVLLALAYARTGLTEIDVYPSRAVLRSSLTVVMVGGYLFVVGVLAQVVRRFGGADSFQFQGLVVLAGLAGLAVLMLSDRLRQRLHGLVSRHFGKAQHDSVRIWSEASRRLASVETPVSLSAACAKLAAGTFDVLSVTMWLLDEPGERLIVGSSTAAQFTNEAAVRQSPASSPALIAGLRGRSSPFDLEQVDEPWAEEWRQLNPTTFANGGDRWCVPLRSGEQTLGALVLGDRVNGVPYTMEELELLQCIAHQTTSVLLNLRLVNEVAHAREMEAFRTMSAFFVHDLKNAAASLNLMLKNLPVHFDDPAFRADALRGVGNTARRIDELIARLGTLRQRPVLAPVRIDMNQLVIEAIDRLDGLPGVQLKKAQQAIPGILGDREQLLSVVTNLLLNARDALGAGGQVEVRTEHRGGRVVLSISDNGCGMSPEFVRDSLFRPFQSTKTKGLGIGMFQSRMTVEAHGGSIQVESAVGQGTSVLVSLVATDAA